jgi:hypothetical protein
MRRSPWFQTQTMGTTASTRMSAITCQRRKLAQPGSSEREGPCHSVSIGSCWLHKPQATSAPASRATVVAKRIVRRQPNRLRKTPLAPASRSTEARALRTSAAVPAASRHRPTLQARASQRLAPNTSREGCVASRLSPGIRREE